MSPSSSDRPSELLSTFVHELKTPLAVITGFAELLGARADERTRREAAARIMQASEQLSGVIDDLLAGLAADEGDLAHRVLVAVEAERRAREGEGST